MSFNDFIKNKFQFCGKLLHKSENRNFMQAYKEFIYYWLMDLSGREMFSKVLTTLIVGTTIITVAFICFFICKRLFISIIHRIAAKTVTEWDDILVKHKFFHALAHLVPATIFYMGAGYASDYFPLLEGYFLKISNIYFLGAFIAIVNSFLNSLNEIYDKSFSAAKERPITGVLQSIKIVFYFICLLILISILFNKNIGTLLTGLGAAAAVLMLVFKDTILGFVASIQIGMNKLLKVGDFIELPNKNLDGTVTEINLTCVKIQNGNKTIISVPTYSIVSESFINWDGMEKSGVRRIQRSIKIDMTSVKFCDEKMIESFRNNPIINKNLDWNFSSIEKPTNLGVFRRYLEEYLRVKPIFDPSINFVVRYLQPTENGIPVEINVYSKEQRWVEYEKIQADIFDHVLAIVPEFELRVFQNPTGADFKSLVTEND